MRTDLRPMELLFSTAMVSFPPPKVWPQLTVLTGLAYIGLQAPTWSGTSTNITFTTNSSDDTVPWTINTNSTTISFNETLELYIVPANTSYTQVGFVSTTGTAPAGAVTTGFAWFGAQVAYAASESDYELMFWATSTNETGIYGLYVCLSLPCRVLEGHMLTENLAVERCWLSLKWIIPCGNQEHSPNGCLRGCSCDMISFSWVGFGINGVVLYLWERRDWVFRWVLVERIYLYAK